ncbi:radical SAM/SPASM domain-containing protein [Ciceribacter thiooxidans]|uniref:Radical SAM/SPASM domain-containing protein n=1 Tax=Ciceribacter thiooxidans TaxID=1969821 RepID=A0ABV7I2G6_9HYPH|nr:radical SAM/SPASM domain-containing protein [Ciceribacter thiooxidans]
MSYFDLIEPDHLAALDDRGVARNLFRRTVSMVEIELFSYCNRKCWFCPNAHIDRISRNIHMSPATYTRIISQLAEVEYRGVISFSRYNEPLADRVILERAAQARAALPKARLHTNTNGDYLDIGYLDDLYSSGFRSINIQIYLQNGEKYNHEKTKRRAQQSLRRLQIPYDVTRDDPGLWYEMKLHFKDMNLRLYGRNFSENGTSRGNQVDIKRDYVRTLPCSQPFWGVYIDYTGQMMPCCNYRSDIAEHGEYVLGDIDQGDDLFLSYANGKAATFRRSLLRDGPKDGPCASCHFALEEVSPKQQQRLDLLFEGSK